MSEQFLYQAFLCLAVAHRFVGWRSISANCHNLVVMWAWCILYRTVSSTEQQMNGPDESVARHTAYLLLKLF